MSVASTTSSSTTSSSSSSTGTPSSVPDLVQAPADDDASAVGRNECYDKNYEKAFELFYMYCQLEASAAAHFAEMAAADLWTSLGFVASEASIVNTVRLRLLSQYFLTGVWDKFLPAAVRVQLATETDRDAIDTVLDEWMHREWLTAPGPAYAPNFEYAFGFFYDALDLDSEAAAHFAQRVASDYSDAMRLPLAEPACGLCDALMKEFSETGEWDVYLPTDVLQELEEECTSYVDRRAVLEDWLELPEDGAEYKKNYDTAFEQFYNTSGLSAKQASYCAEMVADEFPNNCVLSSSQAYECLVDCLENSEDTKWDDVIPASVQKELNACAPEDYEEREQVLREWLRANLAENGSESGGDSDSDSSSSDDDEPQTQRVEVEMKVADRTMKELTASIYCVAYSVIAAGLMTALSKLGAPYCY